MKRAFLILFGETLGRLPVKVRSGAAKGAWWSLFPRSSYWRGTHEPTVQAAIAAIGGGDIRAWSCWDLGAHFGLYSVALALGTGAEGEVAAFEPDPDSFARLELHKKRNRLHWLKTYRAAASDVSGKGRLLTHGHRASTSAHLRYDDETPTADCAPITVDTLRLDDEVAGGRLRRPQFAKIDVEGHAHHALAGMAETLSASRPQLIISFHSKEEVEGTLALLQPLGYKWTAVIEPTGPPDTLIGGDYLFIPQS